MIGTRDRRLLQGPAGAVEVVLDWPSTAAVDAALRRRVDGPAGAGAAQGHATSPAAPRRAVGLAVVGHPHPLYGGTLDNKVAATLARTFSGLGWLAARFNFRGVGRSAGTHDHGIGETDDFAWLADTLLADGDIAGALAAGTGHGPGEAGVAPPLAFAGFSFGTFVAARAAERFAALGRAPRHLVLVGAAAGKWAMPPVPAQTVVIHGERDDTIPLSDVLAWAGPLELPVIVVPQADHFFPRRLTVLRALVVRNLLGSEALPAPGHGPGAPGSADAGEAD